MATLDVSPATVLLGSTVVTSTSGAFSGVVELDGEVPNSLSCRYWVELQFGETSTACAPSSNSLRVDKIRLHSRNPDRIFRNSFRIHVPSGV